MNIEHRTSLENKDDEADIMSWKLCRLDEKTKSSQSPLSLFFLSVDERMELRTDIGDKHKNG